MKFFLKNKKGFTLIELLVVISIISLLSSIVFTTLSNTKAKAKDTVIKQELKELSNLAYLNHLEYGTFNDLMGITVTNSENDPLAKCNEATGMYKSQFVSLCNKIVSLNKNSGMSSYIFLTGTNNDDYPRTDYFSFVAWLPSEGKYFCVGKSGSSISNSWSSGLGCYGNP